MNEIPNEIDLETVSSAEQAADLMGMLFAVADTTSVFSEPVAAGEYTVITASEVSAVGGFGFGSGGGTDAPASEEARQGGGWGNGGGGGGGSMARPVAVISIGPDGVQVEPIVDPTKIALALFTAVGGMVLGLLQMRRK